MYKGVLAVFATLTVGALLLVGQVSAQNSVKIAVAAGYAKNGGTFDVVVKDNPGTKLVMYVNDKNPTKATVNKKDWATFHRVKLVGSGKVSFTKVLKKNGKSYQKPINYTKLYKVAGGKVKFSNPPRVSTTQASTQTQAPASTPAPMSAPAPAPQPTCTNGTYVNSAGNTVCSPEESSSSPSGATAQCVDGTYSFSQSRRGTCSHHGGVAQWL